MEIPTANIWSPQETLGDVNWNWKGITGREGEPEVRSWLVASKVAKRKEHHIARLNIGVCGD